MKSVSCTRCHKLARADMPCRWCGSVEHLHGFRLGAHTFSSEAVLDPLGKPVQVRWECGCGGQGRWARPARRGQHITWYQKAKAWWSWLAHVLRDEHLPGASRALAKKLKQAS